jgi:hypothetical protein
MKATSLDSYLCQYGHLLGEQASRTLNPLHVPGRDSTHNRIAELLRTALPAQGEAITAGVKSLRVNPSLILNGECGVGKTYMGQGIPHCHADGRAYRALVMCPPQLPEKWARELRETIPGVTVHFIESYRDLTRLSLDDDCHGPEWWIVKETTAKMTAGWEPAFTRYKNRRGFSAPLHAIPRCPNCGQSIVDAHGEPIHPDTLAERKHFCTGTEEHPGCGAALWTYVRDSRGKRKESDNTPWSVARYIQRKLPGYFDYFIPDELHEYKGDASTARANSMGTLASAIRYFIGLTGTLLGGYAWHLRSILLRTSPSSLVAEGFHWDNPTAFNECYGRISERVTEKDGNGSGADNRRSHGRTTKTKKVEPGIMPTMFGRHLMDKVIFLGLDELASDLPEFREHVIPVPMDPQLAAEYRRIERDLTDTMREMLRKNDRRLLGAFVETLLTYPDYPFDWDDVGYWETLGVKPDIVRELVPVVRPKSLPYETIRNKEQALLDIVRKEHAQGRQVWVFVTRTDKHDVAQAIDDLLSGEGFNTKILRAEAVGTSKREAWIAQHAPGVDVMISHPQPVRTGLDLFDKGGRHNFPSLVFYETGYEPFTLRQAARRAYRLCQWADCHVYYLYYSGTMQDRAMTLMGRKIQASEAIEGKFSSEGLAAMGGEDGGMQMALAKSLVNQMDDLGADRAWQRITSQSFGNASLGQAAGTRNRLASPPARRRLVLKQASLFGD